MLTDLAALTLALKESEERFRVLADYTASLIWISDASKACVWFNKSWLDFRGRSLKEESGEGWTKGLHPDDLDRCLKTYFEHFDRRERFEMEHRLQRRDGQYRLIWNIGNPYYVGEEFRGYVGSCLDITERREARNELQRLNAHLETIVEERTQELKATVQELEIFSATVAHDLRAPLRSVAGYAGILKESLEGRLDQEEVRLFSRISSNVDSMGELIEDMLNFAQANRSPVRCQKVLLSDIVSEARSQLDAEILGRHIIWQIEELGTIPADPGLLRQVLINLIANALKFTRERSPAIIRLHRVEKDGHAIFHVTDNGIGFPPEHAARLFKAFERLPTSQEGRGLGLSIVERIITRHGGNVAAEGRPGNGSTFQFSLPLGV